MRVGVIGAGAVGRRAGRELVVREEVTAVTVVSGRRREAARLAASLGPTATSCAVDGWDPEAVAEIVAAQGLDVAVLCGPDEVQADLVRVTLAAGADVVSLADSSVVVDAVARTDDLAKETGRRVLVGAAFSPGWATVLAVHAAALFDDIEEIGVASTGTSGASCAERRSEAVRSDVQEWRDGAWVDCPARSGPELVWFPEPVGAVDCARGDSGEAILIHRLLPSAGQISVKLGRPESRPLPRRVRLGRDDGDPREVGSVRVAVSGRIDGQPSTVVYGMCAPPAAASGVLAALAASALAPASALVDTPIPSGSFVIAEAVPAVRLLAAGATRGVRGLVYDAID